MTGQDVIGSSLTFSTMTLPSLPLQGPSQSQQSQTTGESRLVPQSFDLPFGEGLVHSSFNSRESTFSVPIPVLSRVRGRHLVNNTKEITKNQILDLTRKSPAQLLLIELM